MPIAEGDWYRTCQECGHEQKAQEPSSKFTSSYANAKCRKCHSMALDYGKHKSNDDDWANE